MKTDAVKAFLAGTLRSPDRWFHVGFGVLLILTLGNTLFLLARRYLIGCDLSEFEGCVVSPFYQWMVLSHSALGIALCAAAVVFLIRHIADKWRLVPRRAGSLVTGVSTMLILSVLLGSGFHFLLEAKTAEMEWLYWLHIGLGAVVLLAYVGHRHLARPLLTRGSSIALAATATIAAAVLVAGELSVTEETPPVPEVSTLKDGYGYEAPSKVTTAHPFFPSAVQLASGASQTADLRLLTLESLDDSDAVRTEVATRGFASDIPIGARKCGRCHAETVRQWSMSAHRFSSFNNPFYVATIKYLRGNTHRPNEFLHAHMAGTGLPADLAGRVKSRWCASCHDPVLLFSGRMTEEIDIGSVQAQAGLTCLACHGIHDIPDNTGNGNYVWNDVHDDSYILSDAKGGTSGARVHDLYLNANPERHRSDMLKLFFRKSGFCATCHKVSLDRPVNDYRWLRGQNEFDAWHSSGVALNAARTFYLPGVRRECQDCHMPMVEAELPDVAAENGRIRSHFFGAANTALPFLRGDEEAIREIEANLSDRKLRVHFGGVVTGEAELVLFDAGTPIGIEPVGDALEMHVVVRNLGVGHTFPGGTNDSNEAWIEVVLFDEGGEVLADVGARRPDGRIERNTRFYNALFVDRDGRRIEKRNAHEAVSPVYVKVIPPGTADVARFSLPADLLPDGRELTLRARLMWRKFNQTYTNFAFAANPDGFAAFDAPPELPITVVAASEMKLTRAGGRIEIAPRAVAAAPEIALHDYAIGLLRQGDTALAERVAGAAVEAGRTCWNCRRTHVLTLMRAGKFKEARTHLAALEGELPRDPQSAWLWARLLMREGDFNRALKAIDAVLRAFPEDREALKLKSRIGYLAGDTMIARDAAEAALVIDPEDATANYFAMLAYKADRVEDKARTFEAAFAYHQKDDLAQQATFEFRRSDDEFNFVSQRIQVFEIE